MTNSDPASGMRQEEAVDIWLTKLADVDDDMRHAYEGLLDQSEKVRLSQFLARHARDQFLVTRALLRTALSNHANVPRRAWHFGTNDYGKPHIGGAYTGIFLKFNLSHTNGVVACAVSHGHDVGIDIEYMQHDLDYLEIAHQVFAQAEIAELTRLPPCAQRQRFYTLWTLKEAYVKAVGKGLFIPLDAFWFDLDRETPRIQFRSNPLTAPTHWRFVSLNPTPEHALALAIDMPPAQPVRASVHWTIPPA